MPSVRRSARCSSWWCRSPTRWSSSRCSTTSRSMPEGPLRTSLLQLAREDGVPVDDVLVADASRRTSSLNAYVSGIGATRRIVVYDTLVETASPEQVRLDRGARARATPRSATCAWGTFAGCDRGGVRGVRAGAARPLAVAARAGPASTRSATAARWPCCWRWWPLLGLVAGPVQNLLSRRVETRADVHALDLTRDPQGIVEMQRRLVGDEPVRPRPARRWCSGCSRRTRPARSGIALARDWAGCTTCRFRRDCRGDPHPRRHQRLPAAGGRHRVVRARDGAADGPGPGGRAHRSPARGRGLRRRPGLPGDPRPVADHAADAGDHHARGRDREGPGLRLGVVRRGRAAGPDGLVAAGGPAYGGRSASTHGHEVWWAKAPGSRVSCCTGSARPTTCSPTSGSTPASQIARALSPAAAARMVQLTPGVDTDGVPSRRWTAGRCATGTGWADRPVVVCVSRLVERKGQDTLVRALPLVQAQVPGRGAAARR